MYKVSLEDKTIARPNQTPDVLYPVPEDEISLRELWGIIAKRKWLVFLSTLICLAAAIVYLWLTPAVYESNAMIQVGKVAGQPVDNSAQLASRLMNQYTPVNTVLAVKQLPKLHAVTQDKTDGATLTLEAYGKSPQEAQQYLKKIIQKLLITDQQRYQLLVDMRQTQLKRLQAQYNVMRKSLDHTIGNIGKEPTHVNQALLFLAQSQNNAALTRLDEAIAKEKNALAVNNTSPTIQTLSPRYDPIPVAPKKGVILVLAVLGGLILGVLLALLQNAFRRIS